MNILRDLHGFLSMISSIGIGENLSYVERLRIFIVNQTALLAMVVLVVFFIQAINEGAPSAFINLLLILFPAPALCFNYYRKYQAARIYTAALFPLFMLVAFVVYGPDTGIDYAYTCFILISLILFDGFWTRASYVLLILGVHGLGTWYCAKSGSIYDGMNTAAGRSFVIVIVTLCIGIVIIKLYEEIDNRIRAQNLLNRQLKENNSELMALLDQNESKNQLFSILAHDLKGPIRSFNELSKNISYLLKKGEGERLMDMADYYEKSGSELTYILDNLLKWVISQKDEIQTSFERINLFDLTGEITRGLGKYSEEKEVKIINQINEAVVLHSDINILKIILSNILHNAVKFSKPGGKVFLKVECNPEYGVIEIQDEGIGIKAEELEQLNCPVYRTKRRDFKTGHGLGLKSCFALVKHLKGKIEAKSVQGQGASFFITLPKLASIAKADRAVVEEKTEPCY